MYRLNLKQLEPPRDKTNKMAVRPAKTQINLGIRPVWSESSLCAQWVAKDPSFLHADSEDSDQSGRVPRLIWVFAGRTTSLLVLSWGGSILLFYSKVTTFYLWNTNFVTKTESIFSLGFLFTKGPFGKLWCHRLIWNWRCHDETSNVTRKSVFEVSDQVRLKPA